MPTIDCRQKFFDFFARKGHAIIPSASLIPENDATVLFTTAGMQPLVPYLLGESHPAGTRLANAQKCVRTSDIDEVGDNRHLTFFEMLGNWSLGDYFKQDSIAWSWEFLTSSEWLGIDPQKIYVSVYAGSAAAPRDNEAIARWSELYKSAGVNPQVDMALEHGGRIFSYPARGYLNYSENKNWWQPGPVGPQGPDTEIFYDTGAPHRAAFGPVCHPNCDCGRFIEIWNNVFMQYQRITPDGELIELPKKNVDTGMGLERITVVMEGVATPFETSLFIPIISSIESVCAVRVDASETVRRAVHIIADHARAATFIIGDERGVVPSNVDQGYVARRLIRRAVRYGYALGRRRPFLHTVCTAVVAEYGSAYPELARSAAHITSAVRAEEEKFFNTIASGMHAIDELRTELIAFGRALDTLGGSPHDAGARMELQHISGAEWLAPNEHLQTLITEQDPWSTVALISRVRDTCKISGSFLFTLYSSHGLPLELVRELVLTDANGVSVVFQIPVRFDELSFAEEFKKHQDVSRAGAVQKFSGGLADNSFACTRLHTATHLLHQALRQVLGAHVAQKGSNITPERLRFDFSHPQKMSADDISAAEKIVNEQIQKNLPVKFEMVTVAEAKTRGAIGLFEDMYAQMGDKVKMYMVGDSAHGYFSREICGGPHVDSTGQVGAFKIIKEEAVSAGVRRIKAVIT